MSALLRLSTVLLRAPSLKEPCPVQLDGSRNSMVAFATTFILQGRATAPIGPLCPLNKAHVQRTLGKPKRFHRIVMQSAAAARAETLYVNMYVINAFVAPKSEELLMGNPAAVALLSAEQVEQLDDTMLQKVATEMNQSETAFVSRARGSTEEENRFEIRWFTPAIEVELCGHATLAAAMAVTQEGWAGGGDILFDTRAKGTLRVKAEGDGTFTMDFPALDKREALTSDEAELLQEGLGADVAECFRSDYDIVARLKSGAEVKQVSASMGALSQLDARGIIVTASGEEPVRFVSRFFGPRAGIAEDPVTGSAHCVLAGMFLSDGEEGVEARQLSKRGGWLTVGRPREGIVSLGGCSRVVWRGTVYL